MRSLLVWPQSLPLELAEELLSRVCSEKRDNIRLLKVGHLIPMIDSSWMNLQDQLEDQFIWLPWNWVTYARALAKLPELKQSSPDWGRARLGFQKRSRLPQRALDLRIGPVPEGVAVTSKQHCG